MYKDYIDHVWGGKGYYVICSSYYQPSYFYRDLFIRV